MYWEHPDTWRLLIFAVKARKAGLTWHRNSPKILKVHARARPYTLGSDWKPVSYITGDGEHKKVTIRTGYEIIERTIDRRGQFMFPADLEVNTRWFNTMHIVRMSSSTVK